MFIITPLIHVTCRPMAITTLWENGLFAANIVQCLIAVPRFRESISSAKLQLDTFPPGKLPLAGSDLHYAYSVGATYHFLTSR